MFKGKEAAELSRPVGPREVALAGRRHGTAFRELLGDRRGMRMLLSLKAGAATPELHVLVRDREAGQGWGPGL